MSVGEREGAEITSHSVCKKKKKALKSQFLLETISKRNVLFLLNILKIVFAQIPLENPEIFLHKYLKFHSSGQKRATIKCTTPTNRTE